MSGALDVTLETIEYLDFKPETPCEDDYHAALPAHKADFLVKSIYPCCHPHITDVHAMCRAMWDVAAHGLECGECGALRSRAEVWTILEVLS